MENTEEKVNDDNDFSEEQQEGKPREIVLPGDLLDEGTLKSGMGTYREGKKIFSAHVGIKSVRSNYINVISLSGRYIPKSGDTVIGVVIDLTPTSWILDINSPYSSPLHSSEVPWKIDFGETSRYLDIGDVVLTRVLSVDEIKRIQVTMRGPGLRKLNGGQLIKISASKVPRVIGKNGSMISLIKKYTNCHMFVGQNGRIWIEGTFDDIKLATKAIDIIEQAAHVSGLTSLTEEFLKNQKGMNNL
ncbi:MAG: RNA-binding protein [Thermoplasmata archaeon]|nr:MAG: RNA-binding protein [Thermoplasmata archaeon]